MPDEREDKLPKWARDELLSLRIRIKEMVGALEIANHAAAASGATGKVIAGVLIHDGFPLDDRIQITFNLPNGKIYVMLRENGTLLDINGSLPIHIMPRAANCAYVNLEDRR